METKRRDLKQDCNRNSIKSHPCVPSPVSVAHDRPVPLLEDAVLALVLPLGLLLLLMPVLELLLLLFLLIALKVPVHVGHGRLLQLRGLVRLPELGPALGGRGERL